MREHKNGVSREIDVHLQKSIRWENIIHIHTVWDPYTLIFFLQKLLGKIFKSIHTKSQIKLEKPTNIHLAFSQPYIWLLLPNFLEYKVKAENNLLVKEPLSQ